jgi:hypothetical protein
MIFSSGVNESAVNFMFGLLYQYQVENCKKVGIVRSSCLMKPPTKSKKKKKQVGQDEMMASC